MWVHGDLGQSHPMHDPKAGRRVRSVQSSKKAGGVQGVREEAGQSAQAAGPEAL